MSSPPSVETGLSKNRFEFEVTLQDPRTRLEFTFPCEVDTGNPVALALPEYCTQFFTDFQGHFDFTGAGSKNSPAFSADIVDIDGMDVEYETIAYMMLEDHDYGLLGIDLLKHLRTTIYDEPDSKLLRLEKTHL